MPKVVCELPLEGKITVRLDGVGSEDEGRRLAHWLTSDAVRLEVALAVVTAAFAPSGGGETSALAAAGEVALEDETAWQRATWAPATRLVSYPQIRLQPRWTLHCYLDHCTTAICGAMDGENAMRSRRDVPANAPHCVVCSAAVEAVRRAVAELVGTELAGGDE